MTDQLRSGADGEARATYDVMSDGVIVATHKLVVAYCNTAAIELFRLDSDAVIGASLASLALFENEHLAARMTGGAATTPWFGETVCRRSDADTFPGLVSTFAADGGSTVVIMVRDLSEYQEASATARELMAFARNSALGLLAGDAEGCVTFANPAAEQLLGCAAEEFEGLTVADLATPTSGEALMAAVRRLSPGEASSPIAVTLRDRAGATIPATVTVSLTSETESTTRWLATIVDLTEILTTRGQLERAQAALVDSERSLNVVIDAALEGIVKVKDWRILFANSQMSRMLKVARDDLVGRSLADFVAADHLSLAGELRETNISGRPAHGELQLVAADGERTWVMVSAAPLQTSLGTYDGAVATFTDITDRKALEEALAHRAVQDELTGLPNRVLLKDRLEQAFARRRRTGMRGLALLFVDLDRFKDVNDGRGHAAGDALLSEVARGLGTAVASGDTLARFAGDEFVILCETTAQPGDALDLADRIHQQLSAPITIDGEDIFITASIGITTIGDGCSPDRMLADADAAMREAKRRGRGQTVLFDPCLRTAACDRLKLTSDLRRALHNDEFHCLYQPIVNIASSSVVAVEALVRWQHPELGLLTPNAFLPLAEETGLILQLGAQVLRVACATIAGLGKRIDPLTVSVNLSPLQFADPTLVDLVRDTVDATGIAPERLVLEVTESAVLDDLDTALSVMHDLKTLGVRLAIDDFGTGYSSLLYVKQFPVDHLKIDRAFIAGIGTNVEDSAIVASVISMADALGISTTSEGVETAEQLATLHQLGGRHAQGYLFSRPIPADELPAKIAELRNRSESWRIDRRRSKSSGTAVAPETRRKILTMHQQGASPHTIAAALNRLGMSSPHAARWHPARVAQVITADRQRRLQAMYPPTVNSRATAARCGTPDACGGAVNCDCPIAAYGG